MITTITTTASDDARLATAFGIRLNLGRNATAAEIKAAVVQWLRDVVADTERITAQQAAATPTPIAPT